MALHTRTSAAHSHTTGSPISRGAGLAPRSYAPRHGYAPFQAANQGGSRARQAPPCWAASEGQSQFDVDASRPAKTAEDTELGPRADDVLPDSLAGAVADAAAATAMAVTRGNTRCQVELLLPEFWDPISGPIFPNRGDQERFWRLTRRFVEQLAEQSGIANIKAVRCPAGGVTVTASALISNAAHPSCCTGVASWQHEQRWTCQSSPHRRGAPPRPQIYPDAGVAAMLSHQWQDKTFQIGSLNDR